MVEYLTHGVGPQGNPFRGQMEKAERPKSALELAMVMGILDMRQAAFCTESYIWRIIWIFDPSPDFLNRLIAAQFCQHGAEAKRAR